MYDTIFDDFESIKTQCGDRGRDFDPYTIFGLLEELYDQSSHRGNVVNEVLRMLGVADGPQSTSTPRQVRTMPAASTTDDNQAEDSSSMCSVRSVNDTTFNLDLSRGVQQNDEHDYMDEDGNDSSSNDVVELEVPKKNIETVDLTAPTESDESDNEGPKIEVLSPSVSRSTNEDVVDVSNSKESDASNAMSPGSATSFHPNESRENHNVCSSHQSSPLGFFDDPSSNSFTNLFSNSNQNATNSPEMPFQDVVNFHSVLDSLNVPTSSNQNDNHNGSVLELLEENNNDPNNNTGQNLNNAKPDNNHSSDFRHSDLDPEIIRDFMFPPHHLSPIPGCSKNMNSNIYPTPPKSISGNLNDAFSNPRPGCSKSITYNFSATQEVYPPVNASPMNTDNVDQALNADAECIQEIIPWADMSRIKDYLKSHKGSSNRKELTLWDLMQEQSNNSPEKNKKRKLDTDECTVAAKNARVASDSLLEEFFNPDEAFELTEFLLTETELMQQNNQINVQNETSRDAIQGIRNQLVEQIVEPNQFPDSNNITWSDTSNSNVIKPAKFVAPPQPNPPLTRAITIPPLPLIRPPQFNVPHISSAIATVPNRPATITSHVPDSMQFPLVHHHHPKPTVRNITSTIVRANSSQQQEPIPLIQKTPQKSISQKSAFVNYNGVRVINPPVMPAPTATNVKKEKTTSSKVSKSSNYNKDVYYKLRSMFPGIKKDYIKQICKHPPMTLTSNNPESIISSLIDHLLNEGQNHVHFPEEEHVETLENVSVDEKYNNLAAIFPDADPTYLREFVETNHARENALEEFIQEKLTSRNYPTREQYLAKIKQTEQQKQYTVDFDIKNFLDIFPDPFSHFENQNRICVYELVAFEFFKSHFNRIKVSTITRSYSRSKYNISRAAKLLTGIGSDMKSKRTSTEIPTENIPLLQELAFVRHRDAIQKFITDKKNEEECLRRELEAKNLLIECQCCFDDKCLPAKTSECEAGHVFCNDCVIRGTDTKLGLGETRVGCFVQCESEFSLATLQKVLPPTKFSTLLTKRQAAEIMAAEVEGLESCPFCHFASIPPPEDKVFKCLNPECMKETCRKCKELNHIPLKCDEVVKTEKARLLIEERMTQALLRTCYKCKKQFVKESGCNKMTCTCGALMCYICDKPVKDYQHFNGQGSKLVNLCPLYSDDEYLHAVSVRKAAEETAKQLMKDNPNLKIDTTALLPKVPRPVQGPHNDIANANQLPVHALRILQGRLHDNR